MNVEFTIDNKLLLLGCVCSTSGMCSCGWFGAIGSTDWAGEDIEDGVGEEKRSFALASAYAPWRIEGRREVCGFETGGAAKCLLKLWEVTLVIRLGR